MYPLQPMSEDSVVYQAGILNIFPLPAYCSDSKQGRDAILNEIMQKAEVEDPQPLSEQVTKFVTLRSALEDPFQPPNLESCLKFYECASSLVPFLNQLQIKTVTSSWVVATGQVKSTVDCDPIFALFNAAASLQQSEGETRSTLISRQLYFINFAANIVEKGKLIDARDVIFWQKALVAAQKELELVELLQGGEADQLVIDESISQDQLIQGIDLIHQVIKQFQIAREVAQNSTWCVKKEAALVDKRLHFYLNLQKFMQAMLLQNLAPISAMNLIDEVQRYYQKAQLQEEPIFAQLGQKIKSIVQNMSPPEQPQVVESEIKIPEATPLTIQLFPKGYKQMMAGLLSQTQMVVNQRKQVFSQEQQQFGQKVSQIQQYIEQSGKTVVNSPSLTALQQKQFSLDKLQIVQANSQALQSFYANTQQIYKFLQDFVVADQNNQKQYGQKWDSRQAIPVIYQVMQEVVNAAQALQQAMVGGQQLGQFKPQEFAPVFQLLSSQGSGDQMAQQKQQMLAPIKQQFDLLSQQLQTLFGDAVMKYPVLSSIEDLKQFFISNKIQIVLDPTQMSSNLIAIGKYLDTIVSTQQLQELDKQITACYQQCAQVNQQCAKGDAQQIEGMCQKLMGVATLVENTNQIITNVNGQIPVLQQKAQKLGQEYQEQVQKQWPAFAQGQGMIRIVLGGI